MTKIFIIFLLQSPRQETSWTLVGFESTEQLVISNSGWLIFATYSMYQTECKLFSFIF